MFHHVFKQFFFLYRKKERKRERRKIGKEERGGSKNKAASARKKEGKVNTEEERLSRLEIKKKRGRGEAEGRLRRDNIDQGYGQKICLKSAILDFPGRNLHQTA